MLYAVISLPHHLIKPLYFLRIPVRQIFPFRLPVRKAAHRSDLLPVLQDSLHLFRQILNVASTVTLPKASITDGTIST